LVDEDGWPTVFGCPAVKEDRVDPPLVAIANPVTRKAEITSARRGVSYRGAKATMHEKTPKKKKENRRKRSEEEEKTEGLETPKKKKQRGPGTGKKHKEPCPKWHLELERKLHVSGPTQESNPRIEILGVGSVGGRRVQIHIFTLLKSVWGDEQTRLAAEVCKRVSAGGQTKAALLELRDSWKRK